MESKDNKEKPLGEYYALPFVSMYSSIIPDKHNPKSILNQKKITLFNPLDKVNPYKTIKANEMNFYLLKDHFIVPERRISDTYNADSKNKIYELMQKAQNLIGLFYNEHETEEGNMNQTLANKNKNKNYKN